MPLQAGWQKQWSKSRGVYYYHNAATGESVWERPSGINTEPESREENNRARSDPEVPSPIAIFNSWRQQLLKDGYLDMVALEHALRQHFGTRLPKEVSDALGGLQRVMSSVNSALTAAFATHHFLTMRDLEALVIMSSRDFQGVASFVQLCLGPLSLNPLVRRQIPHAHDVLVRNPHLYDMNAIQVICRVAEIADSSSSRGMNFPMALHSFAQEQGMANASELPVFSRGESYLGSLINRCLASRRDVERAIERQAGHEAGEAARQALRQQSQMGKDRSSRWDRPSIAQQVASATAGTCMDQILNVAEHQSAHALRDDLSARAFRDDPCAAVHASVERTRGASNAAEAVRLILDELRASWSDEAVLGWTLPRLASITLPVADAKQLIFTHGMGTGTRALAFPPVFNNEERKELHGVAEKQGSLFDKQSEGEGVYRALTVKKRNLENAQLLPETIAQAAAVAAQSLQQCSSEKAAETEANTDVGTSSLEPPPERSADGEMRRPDKKWLKSGKGPKKPAALARRDAPMPTHLVTALIGKEIVAPLVTKLAYAGAARHLLRHSPLYPL